MNSFHLHPCILIQPWSHLSSEKCFSSHKLSGWLSTPSPPLLRLSSHPSQLCRARLTRVEQNVPALYLHVRAAFNKLNGVLVSQWEVIAASPCTSVGIGVYHPIILSSSFACNGFEFPSSLGDGYNSWGLHR